MKRLPIAIFPLSENWELAYDPLQWILQKRCVDKIREGYYWQGKHFIAERKRILLRVIDENNIEVDEASKKYLEDLPDTFRAWYDLNGAAEA